MYFSFAYVTEVEGTRHTNEESRPFICIPGGPSAAKAVLSFFFFFFWARSFFLSLLLPSLLGSPLCYEVSVTRFAHIQFGPCRCRQQTKIKGNLLRGFRHIRNFSSFCWFFFFHFLCRARQFHSIRSIRTEGGKKIKSKTTAKEDGGRLLLVNLFIQVSRQRDTRVGLSAVGCLFWPMHIRVRKRWGVSQKVMLRVFFFFWLISKRETKEKKKKKKGINFSSFFFGMIIRGSFSSCAQSVVAILFTRKKEEKFKAPPHVVEYLSVFFFTFHEEREKHFCF